MQEREGQEVARASADGLAVHSRLGEVLGVVSGSDRECGEESGGGYSAVWSEVLLLEQVKAGPGV